MTQIELETTRWTAIYNGFVAYLLIRRMNAHRIIQGCVYLFACIPFGIITLRSIMVGVWGVSISPLRYVAFLSCFALLAGAATSFSNAARGRIIALFALAGIGTVWIPSVVSLVPHYNTIIAPIGYIIFAGYFAAVAFVLFFPNRWRYSILTFTTLCFLTISIGAVSYLSLLKQGEYSRPAFTYFHWNSEPLNNLVINGDADGWIDNNVRGILEQAGIHGTLQWSGSSGERTLPNHVVVLAKTRPTSTGRLYYPRQGSLVYAYDGVQWLKCPSDALTFSSFATLESESSDNTMLYEEVSGGRQGSFAFKW